MWPESERERRARRSKAIGILVTVVVLGVMGGVLALNWRLASTRAALDPTTFCPEKPAHVTVVLMDGTDTLTVMQREAVRLQLERIRDGVPRFGRLEVYEVQPLGNALMRPLVSICNPGRSADVSPLIESRKIADKKYRETFSFRVNRAIDRVATLAPADQSPIMEAIQSVALSAFGRASTDAERRLIVISDLLQNSPRLSMYRGFNPDSPDAYVPLLARLSGVYLQILYLDRSVARGIQGGRHVQYWTRHFVASGARWVSDLDPSEPSVMRIPE